MEVIDNDQTPFFPMRYILDDIILTHESIQWELRQDSIFLNLDFSKAYVWFDWTSMFWVMETLRVPNSFINMIRLLFFDASVFVNINNQATKPFDYVEESVKVAH